ncbi:MAG: hypothetical protein LBF04_04160 [Prevotellaceae bacterium]|jgi:hypothetical protein|nr:hypothetical protein [Prevotellaceae bacterium]
MKKEKTIFILYVRNNKNQTVFLSAFSTVERAGREAEERGFRKKEMNYNVSIIPVNFLNE